MQQDVRNKNGTTIKKSMASIKRNKMIFYSIMMTPLILQFLVFYLYVNLNSFVLAFQEYSYDTGDYALAGFKNFIKIFKDFQTEQYLKSAIVNSLDLFFWMMIFGSVVAIFFSYYIYKQHIGSMLFKIMLYLPNILGGVVVVIMYKYFVDNALPEFAKLLGIEMDGLLFNPKTQRTTIIFYTIFTSFGTQVLVYSSAMSGISDSIIESAELDGITPMKELFYIVLPSVWSTFVTFMVTSVIGIFTHQMSLYTFYGERAEYSLFTFGYYLYRGTVIAKNVDYPYLSAMGLLLTAIALPSTLFIRWALKKFGPSRE